MGLRQDRHIQVGVERRAHAAGRTQRATKRLRQRWQVLVRRVAGQRRLGTWVDRTELAADAVELHPHPLPMTNTAGEHIEQDAAVEHPGNE